MNYSKIAIRYAKALFLEAKEENKLYIVYNDLKNIELLAKSNKDFISFLNSPILSPSNKKSLVESIFKSNIDNLTLKFLFLLLENRRENRLLDVIRNFFTLYNTHLNIINSTLITPIKINDSLLQEFKTKLEKSLSKNVNIENKVDESIIGGFIIQIEDKEFDASIKTQLNKIKYNLKSTTIK